MARESVFSSLHGELSTRKSAPKVNRPWLAFIFASDFYRLLYFWRNLFFSRFFDDDEARRSAVDGADFREKSDQRSPSEVKRMNIYRPRCIKPVLCMYRKRNCFLRDRQPLPGNSFDFHDCRTLPFPRCFFVRNKGHETRQVFRRQRTSRCLSFTIGAEKFKRGSRMNFNKRCRAGQRGD